jgi:hypothetical protein
MIGRGSGAGAGARGRDIALPTVLVRRESCGCGPSAATPQARRTEVGPPVSGGGKGKAAG